MGLKKRIAEELAEFIHVDKDMIYSNLTVPSNSAYGDLSLSCFFLSRIMRKSPELISKELCERAESLKSITELIPKGSYLGIFIDKALYVENTIKAINSDIGNVYKKSSDNDCIVISYGYPDKGSNDFYYRLYSLMFGTALGNILSYSGVHVVSQIETICGGYDDILFRRWNNTSELFGDNGLINDESLLLFNRIKDYPGLTTINDTISLSLKDNHQAPCPLIMGDKSVSRELKDISSMMYFKEHYGCLGSIYISSMNDQVYYNRVFTAMDSLKIIDDYEKINIGLGILSLDMFVIPNMENGLLFDEIRFETLKKPAGLNISQCSYNDLKFISDIISIVKNTKRILDESAVINSTDVIDVEDYKFVFLLDEFDEYLDETVKKLEPCIIINYMCVVVVQLKKTLINIKDKKIDELSSKKIKAALRIIEECFKMIGIGII